MNFRNHKMMYEDDGMNLDASNIKELKEKLKREESNKN